MIFLSAIVSALVHGFVLFFAYLFFKYHYLAERKNISRNPGSTDKQTLGSKGQVLWQLQKEKEGEVQKAIRD
jgi:hypothetical protein